MEILALIPARGGSKSIPHKNIRLLAGVPLLAYSIAAAKQSKLVTRTIVSTDDEEIAKIALGFGAEAPFLRPAEFSQDNTLDFPVFTHVLSWLKDNEGYKPDILLQLRPTSPIRPPECVDQAIQVLLEHPEANSVRGVIPSGQNPFKMWKITEQGRMTPLLSLPGIVEPYNAPRQVLPSNLLANRSHRCNSSFYDCKQRVIKRRRRLSPADRSTLCHRHRHVPRLATR